MTLNRAWECYHAGTRLLSLLWQQIYPFLPSHSSFSDRRRPLRRGTGHWPVPSARQPGGTGHSSAGDKQELALHWLLQFSRKCNTPVPSLALCASWAVHVSRPAAPGPPDLSQKSKTNACEFSHIISDNLGYGTRSHSARKPSPTSPHNRPEMRLRDPETCDQWGPWTREDGTLECK